jgi:hypothetical protein
MRRGVSGRRALREHRRRLSISQLCWVFSCRYNALAFSLGRALYRQEAGVFGGKTPGVNAGTAEGVSPAIMMGIRLSPFLG